MDFEPVRQQAECERKNGQAEEEKSDEHVRGEPDLSRQRRDENCVMVKTIVIAGRSPKKM